MSHHKSLYKSENKVLDISQAQYSQQIKFGNILDICKQAGFETNLNISNSIDYQVIS